MTKWTSRKWLLTLFGELLGGITAVGGALYANQEAFYSGLGVCVVSLAAYLKAEKDVDAAREGKTVFCDCECEECQKKT